MSNSLMTARLALISLLPLLCAATPAVEPEVDPTELPRLLPTAPDKALATFKIKPGFHLELVAAEPLVFSPVAMSFDEDGRLFVVEMRDYSERRPEKLGRIRMLEDTDGDGRFDKSTVYVDQLPWPTAVTCYDGGVFVGATPDILFCKDTDGDGRADVREVVFTGFASDYAPYETNKLNVQALMNSFQWGLDNRIHCATSMSGGKVHLVDNDFTRSWRKRAGVSSPSPGGEGRREGGQNASRSARSHAPIELRGRDFSFDPRTLELRPESGGGQHGMSFDNRGRKFVCSNSDHLQLILYEDRYAARNPYDSMPGPRVSIAADGPAAEVYRISPDEPWRVMRTKWRVAGMVPGPVEGGGRPSGYFTGATGVTLYRGNAFPADFVGDAFIADCGSNLVHRKKLRPDGVGLKAERPADEQKVEFLASTDNWFRPVQFANAPDGCLYIADMYREVIEHPWSLPQNIKQHLDLNSGNDRGRIYRIVPDGFKQPKLPRLAHARTSALVKTLESSNGWHRDTAARLLCERRDRAAAALLEGLIEKSRSPLGRLHALGVLESLDALNAHSLTIALADPDGSVRQRAVRLSEKMLADSRTAHPLAEKVAALRNDTDPLVRYQLAFTMRELPESQRVRVAAALAESGLNDGWTLRAVLSSLGDGAGGLYLQLASDDFKFPGNDTFVPSLAGLIGARNQTNEVATVLVHLPGPPHQGSAIAVVAALADGLERSGSSLSRAAPPGTLQPVFALARNWATNEMPKQIPASNPQVEAIRLLGFGRFDGNAPILFSLLDAKYSEQVQSAALVSLGRFGTPDLAAALLKHWSVFSPRLRSEVLILLLKRTDRIEALLDAMESGGVRSSELNSSQLDFLRHHRDEHVRQRAGQVLGSAAKSSRQEVVDAFQPALSLAGNASRGQIIFQDRCAACHRLGSMGYALGPDLASVRANGREKVLISILDPDREVAPNYQSYLVETRDGESVLGLLAGETATSVTIRQAFGTETVVLRSNIARLESRGRSVMPEGLEAGLTLQDVADLLEFVLTSRLP